MSIGKYEAYNKIRQEYLRYKLEKESPFKNFNESISISRIPVGAVPQLILDKSDQSSKISTSLLYRIIATLHKRYAATDENISVGNLNCKTAQFDRFKEIPTNTDLQIRQVHQNVEMDF